MPRMPGNNLQANPGPLKPTVLPEQPWQHIDMDFWGPLPSGEHILVVINEYSRYPEIEFVSSTGAKAVNPHIEKIFTTHGFPEQVKTDGGPPSNGNKSHEYQQYIKWAGIKATQVSPEDPEANGLIENFMKVLLKIWHISKIEGKNPKQEIYKYLRQYRATPHSSTGRPPAEVLFRRTYHTRLPEFQELVHDPQLWHQDAASKAKQKHYKDHKSNVRPHNITTSDQVLLLQKPTKSHSRYDQDPYTVTDVHGTQITATRNGKVRKRDSKKFKKVTIKAPTNYAALRQAGCWFLSYLSARKQYVSVNGHISDHLNISCGVPQGSVLGPLLFLLYINDLPNVSKLLTFYLFADDTNIYLSSPDLLKLQKTMNRELRKIRKWLAANHLALNIEKTNYVIFILLTGKSQSPYLLK